MKKLLLFGVLFTFTNALFAAEPFEMVLPKREPPVLLSYPDFPIAKWKSRSETNFPWFVETPAGWYLDWDCERRPIEYLIVHHTETSGDATPEELSRIMKRLYRAVYEDEKPKNPYAYGLPMHSAHVLGGKETFSAYHFLIYPSGEIKTTLVPHRKIGDKWYVDMIGWGAGQWGVNCRAIQIALVGDYSKNPPSKEALESLAKLVAHYRKLIPSVIITSHRAVRPQPTDCPGEWWKGWRETIK